MARMKIPLWATRLAGTKSWTVQG